MAWKITLKEGFKNHIEELRRLHGNYNKDVFFWDCVTTQTFDSYGELQDFVRLNIDFEDIDRIKPTEENK